MSEPADVLHVAGHDVRLTHPDKVMYPATADTPDVTKRHVADYYLAVAPALLRQVGSRPATRIRWPDGVAGDSFVEKNLPAYAPDWIPRFTMRHSGQRSGRGPRTLAYPLLDSPAALAYMVQMAALELHTPQWRVDRQAEGTDAFLPVDRIVIDLDPGTGAGLAECCRAAILIRDRMQGAGLSPQCVTSGSKGIQLYAAVPQDGPSAEKWREPKATWSYARALAQLLSEQHPELIVWQMEKDVRTGKVLLDWSQNNTAKTTIAPYSLRGKSRPTAACPVTWDEVESGQARQYLFTEVLARIDKHGDLLAQ